MKCLQKYFCTIFLFLSIIIAGCKTNVGPSSGNDTETTITARFAVTDANNTQCEVTHSGTEHSAKVKTTEAKLSVTAEPIGSTVSIDGKGRTKNFMFTYNGEEQTANVVITYNGKTQNHRVKIRYDGGAIKKLTVTDDDNKSVPVTFSATSGYLANVGTTKAKVEVETFDSADIVTIDSVKTNNKTIVFVPGKPVQKLHVQVTHKTVPENYTVTICYNDPSLAPKETVLTGITVKNADNESEVFPLSPLFQTYNSSYTVVVPATVNKVKVEPTAGSGITAEVADGNVHTLNVGENTIKVTARQSDNPVNAYEYTVTVKKAATGASSNALLDTLKLESKWGGLSKQWKTPPHTFSPTTYSYTCTMDGNCDEFYIQAKPADENATMTVIANGEPPVTLASNANTRFSSLKDGANTFVIMVTAANAANTQTYTINATREKGSYLLKKFSGTHLTPFYAGAFEGYKNKTLSSKNFEATVSSTVSSTTITAEAEYPETTTMKIKVNNGSEENFNGSKVIDLTGSSKEVVVEIILTSSAVTAHGNTYRLTIKKVPVTGENENLLDDLSVTYYGNGYKFYEIKLNETFAPTTTNYTLTLAHGVKEIRVEAKPKSAKAFIDGWMGSSINSFEAPFTTPIEIPVIAENGDRKVYTITVTQLAPVNITIDNIIDNQQINLATLSAEGLTVTGSFNDPASAVTEVWIGSSGLPIQQKLDGKWVQATVNGNTFRAVLPLDTLKELPNGFRDIKAGAFNIRGTAVAIKRVPVTIIGSAVTTAPVTVKIKSSFNIPANASISITALDEKLFQKNEDVVFANKEIPVGNMIFPTAIPLYGIPVGHECRVEVYVYEKIFGKDTLLYSGVAKIDVQAGGQNPCELTLKQAQ